MVWVGGGGGGGGLFLSVLNSANNLSKPQTPDNLWVMGW